MNLELTADGIGGYMSKFSVGDMVQIFYTRSPTDPVACSQVGETGEITHIGEWAAGAILPSGFRTRYGANFIVLFPDGESGNYIADQLRKLPGSAIHSSTLALFTRTQRNPDDVPEKSFG